MMEAIHASKAVLRKEIKHKISTLTTDYKKLQSDIVLRKLFALPIFKDSQRISVYLSTKDEISTDIIVKKIFENNNKCFVPRYNNQIMEMVKLESLRDYDTLPLTKWNIKQPNLTEPRENALETGGLDLIIVPGVAFTTNGIRMGHGKGYYDTFLSKCIEKQEMPPRTVALAFKEQIVDDIPCHDHDIKIDLVLYPD
ncbi:Methenyltetrahydrofolate synthetase [Carabus blaptoides fortunei]